MKGMLKGVYLPLLLYLYFYFAYYLIGKSSFVFGFNDGLYFLLHHHQELSLLLCGLSFIIMLIKHTHFSPLAFSLVLLFPFVRSLYPYIPSLIPSNLTLLEFVLS